jgi:hypothetical protein
MGWRADDRKFGCNTANEDFMARWGASMDPLGTCESAVLTQGVQFLFQQAGELLSRWRARRHDKEAQAPQDTAARVIIDGPQPVDDSPGKETEILLEELISLVRPIQSGKIDPQLPSAIAAIEQLRDVVEAALQTPIRFPGEPLRPVKVSNIHVVAERVKGQVAGLRADLGKMPGGSELAGVRVEASDVEDDVTGVELI